MKIFNPLSIASFGMLLLPLAAAIDIDFTSNSSINTGLALIAKGLMDYYNGNDTGETPGMFSSPYYWWEAGAAWNSILDYWYYTGDDQYNDLLKSSLLYQVGDGWNYMPSNQTTTEGNDDQGFWGVTVMAAAEKNFTNPGDDQPQWLYLAQAVFNTMAARWDSTHCQGGLRWQIYTWNNGYNYKNTVSNGCLFMLAARLARFTGNESYTEWAGKVWDWVELHQFVKTSDDVYPVYDGGYIEDNCSDVVSLEWTYNSGLYMAGAAFMYNHTNETKWLDRAEKIWGRSKVFFMDNTTIMYEAACQPTLKCNNDQRCFKGIYSRFLGLTCLMAPTLNEEIQNHLELTTPGVLQSCTGGSDGHTCGMAWSYSGWDGYYGMGEQMSALEALQNRLIWTKQGPLTSDTGASSSGNGSAGLDSATDLVQNTLSIQTKDKAGAAILTVILVGLFLLSAWWMII